jgi:transcriptional regulator with XRE-family HTH domain
MEVRTMKPLRQALRDLMEERHLTQTDVWAAADLSSAVVSRYLSGERGRRVNSQAAAAIEKLAAVLGVAPDYFIEYRQWRVQEITRRRPALVDQVYDLLIALDRSAGDISK